MPSGVYQRKKQDPIAYFHANVAKSEGCWEWTGFISDGRGRASLNGNRYKLAHRFSYELWVGQIPARLLVCHNCDNPICVRPDHLFLGTNKDNSMDMAKKGRSALQRYPDLTKGERNPAAKLTEDQVREIRKTPRGYGKNKELAERYSVSLALIEKIRHGDVWKDVTA